MQDWRLRHPQKHVHFLDCSINIARSAIGTFRLSPPGQLAERLRCQDPCLAIHAVIHHDVKNCTQQRVRGRLESLDNVENEFAQSPVVSLSQYPDEPFLMFSQLLRLRQLSQLSRHFSPLSKIAENVSTH